MRADPALGQERGGKNTAEQGEWDHPRIEIGTRETRLCRHAEGQDVNAPRGRKQEHGEDGREKQTRLRTPRTEARSEVSHRLDIDDSAAGQHRGWPKGGFRCYSAACHAERVSQDNPCEEATQANREIAE